MALVLSGILSQAADICRAQVARHKVGQQHQRATAQPSRGHQTPQIAAHQPAQQMGGDQAPTKPMPPMVQTAAVSRQAAINTMTRAGVTFWPSPDATSSPNCNTLARGIAMSNSGKVITKAALNKPSFCQVALASEPESQPINTWASSPA